MLEIRGLTIYYESAIAVNDVTIEIGDGEVIGLFGANSAGKSTLLNTLSGLLLERAKKELRRGGERITIFGEVLLDGEDITRMSPWDRIKRGVVLCPERRRLFPEMSVLENLLVGAYLREDKDEIDKDLDFVLKVFPRLRERLNQEAGFLSGGEQQMVAIERSLMSKPRYLLLDEPLLGLAPVLQIELLKAIKRLREEKGVSILIAEQYVSNYTYHR